MDEPVKAFELYRRRPRLVQLDLELLVLLVRKWTSLPDNIPNFLLPNLDGNCITYDLGFDGLKVMGVRVTAE